MTITYRVAMRTMPEAGQMFFKACEAAQRGNPLGMQALDALACCAFPTIRQRAEDARRRFAFQTPAATTAASMSEG